MAILHTPRRVSVSTWALHPLIGTCAPGRPGDTTTSIMAAQPGTIDLLDVPALLNEHGFRTMELCHFHVPTTSDVYLKTLGSAIEDSGVELWSTLIDDGDINDPEFGERDCQWIEMWLDRAAALGSKCARVIAGKQAPTEENVARSIANLTRLADYAQKRGIQVLAENWFSTFSSPEIVSIALESLGGKVGLCFDFGNWGGETKYPDLAAIAEFADSCHAKCNFCDGKPDVRDYETCLQITRETDFSGPYTLVYGEPGSVWESLNVQRDLVVPFLA